MDEDEFQEIEMLGDEFHHALLGAVFENDGTPVPCYSSAMIVDSLMNEGYSEEEAVDYINRMNALTPDKPFLIKYAPGGTHAPHRSHST